MEPFVTLETSAAWLPASNIDTDQLIPARFLRNLRKNGYGQYLFHDLRFDASGAPRPDFILNQPAYRDTRIVAAGENFGCGSSREGAVYALVDYGIRCVIAPSFGDIFRTNCFKNGVLPLRLEEAAIAELLGASTADAPRLSVDLPAQTVSRGNCVHSFQLEPFWKECLLQGLDDIDMTLTYEAQLAAFEHDHLARFPWLSLKNAGALNEG